MKYDYVFFDLDGTLTQSEFSIIESAKYALGELGYEVVDEEALKAFIGPPLYYSFHNIAMLPEEEATEAVRLYREYYEAGAYKNTPVYEGIERTLSLLKDAGCVLAVVTGKVAYMAKEVLEHTGLLSYFAGVFGPTPEQKLPEKEDLIRFAMEALQVPEGSNVLMVGDRHFDIEGAVAVGIDSAGVLYGYGSKEELTEAGATYLAYFPQELLSIVSGTEA